MRLLNRQLLQKLCLSVLMTSTITTSFSFMGLLSVQAASWNSWRSWFSSAPPRPRRGVPRGDTLCLIAPLTASETAQVWSERPTFVWQGDSVARLEVVQGNDSVLWEHTISEADQIKNTIAQTDSPTYAVTMDRALEAGQTYKLQFYERYASGAVAVDVAVLSTQEQTQISNDLEQLDGTSKPAAVQRADYFAGQNLWLDFWQTLISAPMSEDWRNVNSNTIATLCPLLQTSGTLPSVGGSVTEDGSPYMEHRFTGRAGQTVEITLENPDLDTRLMVANSTGTTIEQTENVTVNQNYSKTITLPEDGSYTVRVQAINPQQRGGYNLTVVSKFGGN